MGKIGKPQREHHIERSPKPAREPGINEPVPAKEPAPSREKEKEKVGA